MLRIVALVSGGGTNLQAVLDAIAEGTIKGAEVVGVISSRPDAYALERAANAGIRGECVSPKSFADRADFNKALKDTVDKYNPDLIVLAGYLTILPEQIIRDYRNRIVNIHPSLIPSFCGMGYYGLRVHEAVLARGSKVTGATVHFVDEGADTGPIILQKAVYIQPGDTPEILQKRVMEEAEWKILPEAINAIANGRIEFDEEKNIVWIR